LPGGEEREKGKTRILRKDRFGCNPNSIGRIKEKKVTFWSDWVVAKKKAEGGRRGKSFEPEKGVL